MSGMRAHLASRLRSSSLSTVPPRPESHDYSHSLARAAASILYRTPIPSKEGRPVYILNAAALPDSKEADFDSLLPYVLARLPEEDDLLRGYEYEVVFFAGDGDVGSATGKKNRPGWGWFLQAYHVLSRAMRKRLQRLYIVHEKAWVRILTEIFSTIVSPKFRRKIVHASTLSNLAFQIPIEDLLIPPATYLHDRRISEDIYAPYASGKRAFAARQPFPASKKVKSRFPRVLRETTSFLLLEQNITQEGLFRIPPHSKLKDVLKEAYDRGQKFIVWKDNGVTLPIPPQPRAQHQEEIITEVDPKDAYSVYMAASLIKAWYADLRQPIFPSTSYRDLKRLYGDPDDVPGLDQLTDLITPTSEWSFLPAISREILTRHLLPLLSAVTARQDKNQMTAENLAVCFAPALLCGPDQLEDAKVSSIIRRIITAAVEAWDQGLRQVCGVSTSSFQEDLRLPDDPNDWEDPVEGNKQHIEQDEDEHQSTGIILQDNESVQPQTQNSEMPPPLPPRSAGNSQQATASGRSSSDSYSAPKRKPAPPLQVPPRYSTIVTDAPPLDATESPSTYGVADGFGPPRHTQWDQVPEEKKGEKKTGTGDSHNPPQLILPKRKALTAEQIDNADPAVAHAQERTVSANRGVALPGLHTEVPKRKAVASAQHSPSEIKSADVKASRQTETLSPTGTSPVTESQSATEFRRPSWPASRNPNITSLARPVYPSNLPPNPVTNRPASKSTSLPVPGPKPRTPSPALLQRMPSFETSKGPVAAKEQPTLAPRKLNLRKASVDDLRRLYEERAGTAKTLVRMGSDASRSGEGA
jgi:Rho GTPase-activating protein 1